MSRDAMSRMIGGRVPESPESLGPWLGTGGQLATVRELVAVEALQLTLVAGKRGLDRPIRWAHSIELLDPRPYLRGQELVLSMGSLLTDTERCERFVAAILERHASGIGFGLGNWHETAPPGLRAACERAGLPLIEVPFTVPFIAIIEFLAERLAMQRSERERRAHRRETQLLDLLAGGQGLDGIVRVLSRELGGGAIAVADAEGLVQAIAAVDGSALDVSAALAATLGTAKRLDRRVAQKIGDVSCDLVPVRHQRRSIGWLGYVRPTGESHPEAAEILHEAAPIVSIELATRAQERARDRSVVGRLLQIVRSGVADPIVFAERVADARLDGDRLVASVWDPQAADTLWSSLPRTVLGETDGRLYALVDAPDDLVRVAKAGSLSCGIGSPVPLRELSRSLVEAEAAYQIARGRHGIATWQELASLPTLLGQQSPDRLAAFSTQLVVPIVEYDARRQADLLATLRAFIEHEGGVEATARDLHLHPNSLRHRLRRIHALTGRDPFRFLDRVALYIGIWIWDAEHRRTRQSEARSFVVSDD